MGERCPLGVIYQATSLKMWNGTIFRVGRFFVHSLLSYWRLLIAGLSTVDFVSLLRRSYFCVCILTVFYSLERRCAVIWIWMSFATFCFSFLLRRYILLYIPSLCIQQCSWMYRIQPLYGINVVRYVVSIRHIPHVICRNAL